MTRKRSPGEELGLTSAARRRAASRRKMLLAGLQLIQKGSLRPTIAEIAERAGMHKRSFQAIFTDLDTYYGLLVAEFEDELRGILNETVRRGGNLISIVLLGK